MIDWLWSPSWLMRVIQYNAETPLETAIVCFWADWHEPSVHLLRVLDELSVQFPSLNFVAVDAEAHPGLCETYGVESVPYLLWVMEGSVVQALEGADAPRANALCRTAHDQLLATPIKSSVSIQTLANTTSVMVFMAGTPQDPKTPEGSELVRILAEFECIYGSVNVLSDKKLAADMPDVPLLYISGKRVGGLDVVQQLVASGNLKAMIPAEDPLNVRLEKLINLAPLMLFIKGTPQTPKCGFSRTLMQLLGDYSFQTFDILEDETVRQGLKAYSEWPTFPQVYVHGELVGGLDIVKEMLASDEFPAEFKKIVTE